MGAVSPEGGHKSFRHKVQPSYVLHQTRYTRHKSLRPQVQSSYVLHQTLHPRHKSLRPQVQPSYVPHAPCSPGLRADRGLGVCPNAEGDGAGPQRHCTLGALGVLAVPSRLTCDRQKRQTQSGPIRATRRRSVGSESGPPRGGAPGSGRCRCAPWCSSTPRRPAGGARRAPIGLEQHRRRRRGRGCTGLCVSASFRVTSGFTG